MDRAERDRFGSTSRWSAQVRTEDQSCKAPRGPARGLFDDWVLDRAWQERVLVEQDGRGLPRPSTC